MEVLVRKMIHDLREQVVKIVPEIGEFKIAYALFENPDKAYRVTHWMLKVTQPPKKLDPTETERYLEFVACNRPSPYIAESVVGFGDKQKIINVLLDEDTLTAKILEKMPNLARDLEDV